MSSSAPIVDRIRIIPRPVDFLDRNVGASGEVFFSKETNSLRVYSGKDRSGFEIARADLTNVSDEDLSARLDELNIGGGSGGASVDIGTTPPAEPAVGNLWLNTNTGRLYIYINDGDTSQWIQPAVPSFSGNYDDLSNKPALAQVATSGSYNDLTDKPTFTDTGFDGSYNSLTDAPVLATVATSGSFTDLTSTPTTLVGYGITDAATSAQGTLADSAVQPADLTAYAQLSSATFTGLVTLQQTTEKLNILTGATGIIAHDLNNGAVFYHSGIVANFTANFTNVPTTDNRTISVVLILNQGTTAFIPNALQIDSTVQTINWQGASAPTGNANQIDVVSFTLIRTGAAWTVIGSLTTYG